MLIAIFYFIMILLTLALGSIAIKSFFLHEKIVEETLYWSAAMFSLSIAFTLKLLFVAHLIQPFIYTIVIIYNLNYLGWLFEYRALFVMLKYNSNHLPLYIKKSLRILGLLSLISFIIASIFLGVKLDGSIQLYTDHLFIPDYYRYVNLFYFIEDLILGLGILAILYNFHKHGKEFVDLSCGFSLIVLKEILFFIYTIYPYHFIEYLLLLVAVSGVFFISRAIISLFK